MNSVKFTPDAWEDYLYWQTQDKKTLKRINTLIVDADIEFIEMRFHYRESRG
ncbi:MAG: type II toxin-antitoxin system YoeB family toxin [Synergistaceae bacterium]|jgi:toxin YoeB|nr:type II toxin-antitoxin system YoeB family toxin [Synergistaceae bacterium]